MQLLIEEGLICFLRSTFGSAWIQDL